MDFQIVTKTVKKIINGTCPNCKSKLPPLEREGYYGGWGVVDCPGCKNWFDVQSYSNAGGENIYE